MENTDQIPASWFKPWKLSSLRKTEKYLATDPQILVETLWFYCLKNLSFQKVSEVAVWFLLFFQHQLSLFCFCFFSFDEKPRKGFEKLLHILQFFQTFLCCRINVAKITG